MNFNVLEKDLENAIAADEKYQRENSAKFRAVEQKVATYDEFRITNTVMDLREHLRRLSSGKLCYQCLEIKTIGPSTCCQTVAIPLDISYFFKNYRDIVKASHLTPLEKKEKIFDPTTAQRNVIWNTVAQKNEENFSFNINNRKKKHFTEM